MSERRGRVKREEQDRTTSWWFSSTCNLRIPFTILELTTNWCIWRTLQFSRSLLLSWSWCSVCSSLMLPSCSHCSWIIQIRPMWWWWVITVDSNMLNVAIQRLNMYNLLFLIRNLATKLQIFCNITKKAWWFYSIFSKKKLKGKYPYSDDGRI